VESEIADSSPQLFSAMVEKILSDEQYYHGLLPREDIRQMLRSNGDFLVRSTEPVAGQPRAFVLSVMANQDREKHGIKHYVILQANGKFSIERWGFDSIPEMITYHLTKGESISKSDDQVIIRTPIVRQAWELTHAEIEVTKKLGEGAFGEVSLGKLTLARNSGVKQTIDVAIKLAKLETLKKEQVKEIMLEARLMRKFVHPNVIRIYGVAALQEPLMLVMELADCGALDSYLRKNEVSIDKKCEMCAGAAFGLDYLHTSCNVIHRDIAARNCLYGGGKVKISDFGLTREGQIFQMDLKSRVPIRWLSPETLRTAFYSQKSDVFSYGVLCWEIFSNGGEPYPGMNLMELNVRLREGYRMTFPDGTPREVSTIILERCWTDSPTDRCSMDEMCHFWKRMFPTPAKEKSTRTKSSRSTYSVAPGAKPRARRSKNGKDKEKSCIKKITG